MRIAGCLCLMLLGCSSQDPQVSEEPVVTASTAGVKPAFAAAPEPATAPEPVAAPDVPREQEPTATGAVPPAGAPAPAVKPAAPKPAPRPAARKGQIIEPANDEPAPAPAAAPLEAKKVSPGPAPNATPRDDYDAATQRTRCSALAAHTLQMVQADARVQLLPDSLRTRIEEGVNQEFKTRCISERWSKAVIDCGMKAQDEAAARKCKALHDSGG